MEYLRLPLLLGLAVATLAVRLGYAMGFSPLPLAASATDDAVEAVVLRTSSFLWSVQARVQGLGFFDPRVAGLGAVYLGIGLSCSLP